MFSLYIPVTGEDTLEPTIDDSMGGSSNIVRPEDGLEGTGDRGDSAVGRGEREVRERNSTRIKVVVRREGRETDNTTRKVGSERGGVTDSRRQRDERRR